MLLEDVLHNVRDLSNHTAHEKGLKLDAIISDNARAPVRGDAMRLQQVLTNLVANAVKFTSVGSVTVSVIRTDEGYRFSVRDTGIGFNENQKEIIFGRFQQADGSITRRFGGTGLGLAISRDLVSAMGGVLECDSRPREGAVFWFTLPLADAEIDPESDGLANSMTVPGRVLVVDDNANNRRVAEVLLSTVGAQVVCCETGQSAVDAYLEEDFDLILMDMMMPGMDGMQATRLIRQHEQNSGRARTPIIMLTANSLSSHVEQSLEAGADSHLSKPIDATGLISALSGFLRQAPDR